MKILVLKAKELLWIPIIVIGAILICTFIGKEVSVFSVNGREIPIYSVQRDDNCVSLTFDCAWDNFDVETILDTLDEYNIKATFFMVGSWAEKYPESVKEIYNRGHEIGNHSYNHADYLKMSNDEIVKDLDWCDDVLSSIIGQKPILMRAPSGGYNNTVVKACEESGREYIQWSFDSLDYKSKSVEEIVNRFDGNIKNGDIILMHNGTTYTSKALPIILDKLTKEYKFVKVSELIYPKGEYTIDHAGRQFKK